MVQQRPVTVRGLAKLLQVFGKQGDVVLLDLHALLHLYGIVLMVGDRMMGIRYADLRIRAAGLFATVHEGRYPSDVGLERK